MQLLQTNINNVHSALVDSLWGYRECASVVPDSRLKEKFDAVALERERMVRQLEIHGGATKSTSGSVKGSLTRTWTKIKTSVSSGVLHVLDALAQEEANLKKTYENAIKSSAIDSALNGILILQHRSIEKHLSELRIIQGEAKYSNKWDINTPSPAAKIKEKFQTTGRRLSSKFSTTGTSGENITSKFSTSGPAVDNTTTTTTEHIKEKLQETGTAIKDNLQLTGTVIKENLQSTGIVLKDKLGLGQTQDQHISNPEQLKEELWTAPTDNSSHPLTQEGIKEVLTANTSEVGQI